MLELDELPLETDCAPRCIGVRGVLAVALTMFCLRFDPGCVGK